MDSLEYIDGYFKGDLLPEETRQFDQRIQEDPLFAEEVAYYLSAYAAFKEEYAAERKNNFREIYRQTAGQGESARGNLRRWWPAVAAAALLSGIILCWYLFFNPMSAPKLADQYIRQNLDLLSVQMGVPDSMQTGLILYNEGKFPDALQQFENILRSDSSNSNALINAGIVSLRIERFDKALNFFRRVELRTGLRSNPSLFYEALTLMKRDGAGDASQAKQFLQEVVRRDLDKKEDALQLLGKM
jgi:tetratricopeptide (TPR) repeat protein